MNLSTIFTPDIIIILLGGAIITTVVNLLKKKFTNLNSQLSVAIIALILGVIYQVFAVFVPVTMQESIITFTVQSGATAVLLYEFFWKNFFNKEDSKKTKTKNKIE